jgi:hypothetical protein
VELILTAGLLAQALVALLAASAFAGVGFGVAAWRYRRALQAREIALAELDRVQEGRTLLAELRGQGLALQALAVGLDRLERQWTLDAHHAVAPGRQARAGYELAIRLAQGGASVDELCASCGMTRSEAELVLRLHRVGQSPSSARRLALAG